MTLANWTQKLLLFFAGAGTLLLGVHLAWALNQSLWTAVLIDGLALGLAGGLVAALVLRQWTAVFLYLSAAHFLIGMAYLAPGFIENGYPEGNVTLVLVQGMLFLGAASMTAPNWPLWGIFAGLTGLMSAGALVFSPSGMLSPGQEASLGFFYAIALFAAGWLRSALWRLDRLRSQEADQKNTLKEAKSLQELQFSWLGHDLRSPLSLGLYALEYLEASPLSPEQREHLGLLRQSQVYLLEDLDLYLQGHSPGEWRFEAVPTDLGALGWELSRLFTPAAQRKKLNLRYEGPRPGETAVRPLPMHLLRHILLNLLGNALRYTAQGEVCLRVHRSPRIGFEVIDTGPGLPADLVKDSLLTVEGPGRPSTEPLLPQEHSYGLGLGLVQRLCERLGSRLEVRTGSRGTCFRFFLPEPC